MNRYCQQCVRRYSDICKECTFNDIGCPPMFYEPSQEVKERRKAREMREVERKWR